MSALGPCCITAAGSSALQRMQELLPGTTHIALSGKSNVEVSCAYAVFREGDTADMGVHAEQCPAMERRCTGGLKGRAPSLLCTEC